MDVKNTHSVTKTEISVFGRQALDAERRRSPSLADKVLSVSLASNVPGYETPRCYVAEGDSGKLVADMMAGLVATSDAAYDMLKPSYESVLDQLKARKKHGTMLKAKLIQRKRRMRRRARRIHSIRVRDSFMVGCVSYRSLASTLGSTT